MRTIDRKGLPIVLAALLFAVVMGFLHVMLRGINGDFGTGFAVGLGIGVLMSLIAVGWRRGELAPDRNVQVLPPDERRR